MGEIVQMTMAKASDKEIEQAIILAGVIEDADSGQFPRWIDGEFKEDDPEHFDEDDIDHLKEFYKRVTRLSRGMFRVTFGFSTLMNPDNELVDPDKDSLALHPRLIKAVEALNQPWCVHILGPDDLIAMESKEAADLEAAKINKSVGRNWQEGDPETNAIVIPWPGTVESHAAALAEILAESV